MSPSGGGRFGHRKHRQAFGHNPRSSRQKLQMQLDARNRESEKKRPKPEMHDSLKDVFEPKK